MHEVLVNRLGDLSLPRKSVVRLTDCPDMTLDVYRGRKTTMQCNNDPLKLDFIAFNISSRKRNTSSRKRIADTDVARTLRIRAKVFLRSYGAVIRFL